MRRVPAYPGASSSANGVLSHSTGLYTGNVVITHVDTGAVIKTFEVTEVPVRCVRFIARRNWFVCGSDDFHLRIFNYNTGEKVTADRKSVV